MNHTLIQMTNYTTSSGTNRSQNICGCIHDGDWQWEQWHNIEKTKFNRRKNDIYLGDLERGGENEKKRKEKTKDIYVQGREKGKMKINENKKLIFTLWAIETRKEKSKYNLSMKEGSCFVLQLGDPPNEDTSDCVLGVFGKLWTRRGAWAWFHDVWTCGEKVLEY